MLSAYKGKFVTPEVAVQAVQSGDWVDYGFGAGFPELLDRALAARKGEVKDVKVRGGLVIRPRIEVVESDPEQESFSYYSWHIGDYERKLQTRGLVKFLPVALRYLPYLSKEGWIITSSAPFVNIPNYPDVDALLAELDAQPHVVALDVKQLAKEHQMPKSANVILLGAAAAFLKVLDAPTLRESVARIFAAKGEAVVSLNQQAFDLGHDYVKQLHAQCL